MIWCVLQEQADTRGQAEQDACSDEAKQNTRMCVVQTKKSSQQQDSQRPNQEVEAELRKSPKAKIARIEANRSKEPEVEDAQGARTPSGDEAGTGSQDSAKTPATTTRTAAASIEPQSQLATPSERQAASSAHFAHSAGPSPQLGRAVL